MAFYQQLIKNKTMARQHVITTLFVLVLGALAAAYLITGKVIFLEHTSACLLGWGAGALIGDVFDLFKDTWRKREQSPDS